MKLVKIQVVDTIVASMTIGAWGCTYSPPLKHESVVPQIAVTDALEKLVKEFSGDSFTISVTPHGDIDDAYLEPAYRGSKR